LFARIYAARVLADAAPTRKAEAVPFLAEALKDSDWCGEAARLLEEFGPTGRPAVPALLRTLKDPNRFNRVSAASALVQIDPKHNGEVLPVLIESLGDKVNRLGAANVLAKIGPQARAAVPQLRAILGEERSNEVTK